MAQIIEFGAAPDIDAMDAAALRDYLAEIRERIARLDEDEPEDMASEAYDEWSEQHEKLEDIADEFAKYFDTSKITVVLTAEASGIALATICAQKYGVPMLFAKKAKSDNIESGLYQSEVFSYTYKKRVTLLVSQEWLNADDHVLIIDDFMANGFAVQGLVDIVNEAGAKLEGIGIAVEKGFQGGGDRFRASGIPYKALAVIEKADENGFVFREE